MELRSHIDPETEVIAAASPTVMVDTIVYRGTNLNGGNGDHFWTDDLEAARRYAWMFGGGLSKDLAILRGRLAAELIDLTMTGLNSYDHHVPVNSVSTDYTTHHQTYEHKTYFIDRETVDVLDVEIIQHPPDLTS